MIKASLMCQVNVTQRRLGYPQAQERLLGKAEVADRHGEWKTVPHPEFLLAKASFMRTLNHGQPWGGDLTKLWAEPWWGEVAGRVPGQTLGRCYSLRLGSLSMNLSLHHDFSHPLRFL